MTLNVDGHDELDLAGVERTGQATDRRADHERPQLELEGGHAHDLGGVLVLADGDPGPTDAGPLEVPDDHQHDDDEHHRQPEPERPGVERRRVLPAEKTPLGRSSLTPGDRVGDLREALTAAA